MQGQTVSNGAANDRGGVFVALAAAVSCKGFLPGVGQAGLWHVVGDPEAGGAHRAGSAQEVLGKCNDHLWV